MPGTRYSSKMEGLKVKEKKDHYDFPDKNPDIAIYYNSGVWKIKAIYDNIWHNGVNYHTGDTIFTFNDGTTDTTYHCTARHTETVPYENITYYVTVITEMVQDGTVTALANSNIIYNVRSKGDYVFIEKYVDGTLYGSDKVTVEDIRQYQQVYGKKPLKKFDLGFDWHGMDPESGYPQMSITIISENDNLRYKDLDFVTGDEIITWQFQTGDVNLRIYDETNKRKTAELVANEVYTYNVTSSGDSVTVKKLQNGGIVGTKTINSEDIRQHKLKYNGKLLKVFGLKFDWHGMDPGSGYPQMSYTIFSGSDFITYEDVKKFDNDEIITWQVNQSIDINIQDSSSKHEVSMTSSMKTIVTIRQKGGENKEETFDKDKVNFDVLYDHVKAYYNGHYHNAMFLVYDNPSVDNCWIKKFDSLALTYADPYWFLMTTAAGVEYNNRVYEARKLVRVWKPSEQVDMYFIHRTSRKKANSGIPFDDIKYDIVSAASDNSVTVTEMIRHYTLVSEEESQAGDWETGETRKFYPSEAPVIFKNIEFRLHGNEWTIYSKCPYIKYDGKQYPKNRSVVSFFIDEDLHIEIKDETNKYEVSKEVSVRIESVQAVITNYEVHTSEIANTIKVVKSVNGIEEPWVTIHYYDAQLKYFYVDDLIFGFIENTWSLISNSDDLYFNGTNYKKNESITSWGFNDIIKFDNIEVIGTEPSGDTLKVTKNELTGWKAPIGLDYDETLTVNVNGEEVDTIYIGHNFAKGIWIIKAKNAEIYHDGHQYDIDEEILTLKDGENFRSAESPFTVLFKDISVVPYRLITYDIFESYDIIEKITTLNVGNVAYANRTSNPQDKITFVKTSNASSMYGYIWKRWPSPGPTPWKDYDFDIIAINCREDYNGYQYIAEVNTTFGRRKVKRVAYSQIYGTYTVVQGWIVVNDFQLKAYLASSISSGAALQNYARINPQSGYSNYSIGSVPNATKLINPAYCIDKNYTDYFYIYTRSYNSSTHDLTVTRYLCSRNNAGISSQFSAVSNLSLLVFGGNVSPVYGNGVDIIPYVIETNESLKLFSSAWIFNTFNGSYTNNAISSVTIDKDSCEVTDITQAYTFSNYNEMRNEMRDDIGTRNPDYDTYILACVDYEMLIALCYKMYINNGVEKIWCYMIKYDMKEGTYSEPVKYNDVIPKYFSVRKRIICNNKLYTYNQSDTTIKIYESDISLDALMDEDMQLVNTIEQTDTFNIFMLDTEQYETFTIWDFLKHDEIDVLKYNSTIGRFGDHKQGVFLYADYNKPLNIYLDKKIAYIDDPTFVRTDANFGWTASTMQSSSQIGD